MKHRVLVALAAAPLPVLGPLLVMHAALLFTAPTDAAAILASASGLLLYGYGATFAIGIPIHLVLRRQGCSRLSAYVGLAIVAALFTGCALAVLEMLFPPSLEANPFGLTMWSRFGLGAIAGFAAGASASAWVFWSLAVRPTRI